MIGNESTINGLSLNAFTKFRWNNWCNALWDPQPGQWNPVTVLNGQERKKVESDVEEGL